MTPQEIVSALDEESRKLLESQGLTVSQGMADLLNQAALKGFQLGSRVTASMIEGALTVQLAKVKVEK